MSSGRIISFRVTRSTMLCWSPVPSKAVRRGVLPVNLCCKPSMRSRSSKALQPGLTGRRTR